MQQFRPDLRRSRLTEVTPEDIRQLGASVILLDADNTSSYDNTTKPLPGTPEWVQRMKDAGFRILLLSNAKPDRAGKLAEQYDIPVVGLAAKPLPFGFRRAAGKMHCRMSDMVMIGDQLFTDIRGANRVGVRTIFVERYQKEERKPYYYPFVRLAETVLLFGQDVADWVRGKDTETKEGTKR